MNAFASVSLSELAVLQGNLIYQENVELHKEVDLIHQENRDLYEKVLICKTVYRLQMLKPVPK